MRHVQQLSIRGGVDLVAGDEVVTVKSITKVDGPTRVYNLEVASLDGQITHNYFVGEDEIWTHNAKKRDIKQFEFAFKEIQKFLGVKLNRKDRRRLHDEITKQDCSIDEIIDTGIDMFGNRK